ncbi:MAG: tetratricopeptide repeat protein, partial [Meiothermus sp.]|nr:tetratricopeptide repeat protein [Meiothermus sp.]
ELAARNREAFLPDLASSLNSQSNRQSEVGDREGALATIEEAVNIRRELAARNREAFLPDLASSLNNQSNRQSAVGDREGALASAQEGLVYYRELDVRVPGAFNVDYSTMASVLSDRLVESGDTQGAAKAAEEAVRILEPVFQAVPAAVSSKMALFAKEYIERCEAAGLEPDAGLLSRIVAKLQSFQPQESEQANRTAQMAELLANLPDALMQALQSGDAEKFMAALAELPPEQQQAILAAIQAQSAGSEQQPDRTLQELLERFDPLLQGIAAVALGNTGVKADIEELLPKFEEGGWLFPQAVRRIWAGERELQRLIDGMDDQDTALVRRLLEIIQS